MLGSGGGGMAEAAGEESGVQLRVEAPPSPGVRVRSTPPRSAPLRRPRSPAALGSPGASSCDRFIPNRGAFDMAVSQFEIARAGDAENARHDYNASPAKEEYKRELASTLYHAQPCSNRVLAFSPRAAPAPPSPSASLRVLYSLNRDALNTPKRHLRPIPQMAERILDAPDLIDDFYLNLLDWSASRGGMRDGGMGWDGMGWDGMGWDGMGWCAMGKDVRCGGVRRPRRLASALPREPHQPQEPSEGRDVPRGAGRQGRAARAPDHHHTTPHWAQLRYAHTCGWCTPSRLTPHALLRRSPALARCALRAARRAARCAARASRRAGARATCS